jgi:CRISPR-associated endonuclease/helicase Cas3
LNELYSHPDKKLSEHLREVAEASQIIASYHVLDEVAKQRLDELVRLHDFGKGTTFFQEYITYKPDPSRWTGNPESKRHTPLGMLASAILKEKQTLSNDWLLHIGTSVLGHHTQLPIRKDISRKLQDEARIILKQLVDLPLQELSALTSFVYNVTDFTSSEETIFNTLDTYEFLFEWLDNLSIQQAVHERLKTQRLFSILLEADKAFLALSPGAQEQYKNRQPVNLSGEVVDIYLNGQPDSPINSLRKEARANALTTLGQHLDKGIYTLTLPTGVGKTLTAASLALELRKKQQRKIIIVLPFLSIVDQTSKVYTDVLKSPNQEKLDEGILIQSHSLSSRDYLELEDGDAEFFLDTWQSDIVITTFDQVLLALFSSRAKHQMRFHHLCDAIIVFDEVQALPTQLWNITKEALESLTTYFGSNVIAMSATQPGFVTGQELVPNVADVFKQFGRYRLVLKHKQDTPIGEFVELIRSRHAELSIKRTLVTCNTRRSARRLYDELNAWQHDAFPVYFLSADVTPKDRLAVISEIKNNYPQPCLVISTQVIEAGVDIDMDLVMRDFAPLDSIIQVAGRCNRNNRKSRCDVEVFSLLSEKEKRYSELVYKNESEPDISLQETRKVFENLESVNEEDVLGLCERYFASIHHHKDLGQKNTRNWAYFEEHIEVSKLLRGDQDSQYQFIVAERDEDVPSLEEEINMALAIKDRWEKRRAFKKLAPRLAQVTVNVWAQRGFEPSSIARKVGTMWFVHEGFYDFKRGLDIARGHSDDSNSF